MKKAEPRTCHISDRDCLAPAGYRCGGGIAYGDKSCRGICARCGQPVCANCSFMVQRRRECFDCIQSERSSDYLDYRLTRRYSEQLEKGGLR